jgi:hypothetical protein
MARVREFKLQDSGSYQLTKICEARSEYPAPKNITHFLSSYLPFDDRNQQKLNVSNMLGMKIPDFVLKSGQVYDAYDGKRIIYEVGCNTVIYTLVNPKGASNYEFYLQSINGFVFDSTNRSVAAKVVKTTAPLKTIVKYEMYFLLGLMSAASLPALILVTGTDITVSGILAKKKFEAGKKLSATLYAERENIAEYAPVLHSKIEQFLVAGAKVKWSGFGKKLPETIVNDEKTQAQLAGVLVGKAELSPHPFTVWTAVLTILSTAAIKSVTKSPDAYAKALDSKYRPILEDIQSVDFNHPAAVAAAAQKFRYLLEEAGVKVTDAEAAQMLREIYTNRDKLETSLRNVSQALYEFKLVFDE